ncbi:hypothetical protein L7F22_056234 [Adiantum nelumboides]|nr:hypothetical protein [Adiantum nelumboides]
MRPEQSGSILQCRYSKNNVKLNVLHVLNERLQAIELRIQTSELKEEESRHLPKKDDQGHSTKEGTSSSDKSETMSLQPTEQKNEKTDSPSLVTRPDEPTKSNLQPATPQSESKPSMQQAGSKPDQSDEAGTERLHSTV